MFGSAIQSNYIGFVVIVSAILGGGTNQPLWTDQFLAVLMIPAIIIGYSQFTKDAIAPAVKLFLVVTLLFVLAHFLPFSRPTVLEQGPLHQDSIKIFSIAPSRSLSSILFFLPLVGLFLMMSSLEQKHQIRVLKFILLGLVCNLVYAIYQLSLPVDFGFDGFLPYELTTGFMANENHFSTLVFMCIPFIAWTFLIKRKNPALYFFISSLILLILFAVGSRAGMAISLVITLFMFCWFLVNPKIRPNMITSITLTVLIIVGASLTIVYLLYETRLFDGRDDNFKYTIAAIRDHWIFGSGLGSFANVYPVYVPLDELYPKFAYHTHNEYLELFLEGGVIAGILMFVFVYLTISEMFKTKLSQVAGISIFAVLLHSLVEFPLRTYAVAVIFTLLCAILFSRKNETIKRKSA